ncbi:MAG: sigma-70 family RNA polymerase sigma factor [bacterium]
MEEIKIEKYYHWAISKVNAVYPKLVNCGVKVERDDLIQEALLGLVEAARAFNPEKGAKFTTYAFYRVNGAIRDFLRKSDYLPPEKRKKLSEYKRIKEEFAQALGREPTRKEMAEKLCISEKEVKEIESWHLVFISLDTPIFTKNGEEVEISDIIPTGNKRPGQKLEEKEIVRALNSCIEQLPLIEKKIIEQRYVEGKTLKEVAETLGMSIPTTQRKEKKAKQILKKCMEKKGWSMIDVL